MTLSEVLDAPFAIACSGGGAKAAFIAGALAELAEYDGVLSNVRAVYGSSGGALAGSQFALSACARNRAKARALPDLWLAHNPIALAVGTRATPVLPSWVGVAACVARTFLGHEPESWGLLQAVREAVSTADWRTLVRGASRTHRPVDFGVVVCSTTGVSKLVSTTQVHDPGVLQRALAATASIPGVFPPVEVWAGERYVDGCLVDFTPASLLLHSDVMGAIKGVVTLSVNPVEDSSRGLSTPVTSVGQRVARMVAGSPSHASPWPVHRIGPPAPLGFGPLDFSVEKMEAAIELGRKTTAAALSS